MWRSQERTEGPWVSSLLGWHPAQGQGTAGDSLGMGIFPVHLSLQESSTSCSPRVGNLGHPEGVILP